MLVAKILVRVIEEGATIAETLSVPLALDTSNYNLASLSSKVMKAINANSALRCRHAFRTCAPCRSVAGCVGLAFRQLRKAVALAPRGERAQWLPSSETECAQFCIIVWSAVSMWKAANPSRHTADLPTAGH